MIINKTIIHLLFLLCLNFCVVRAGEITGEISGKVYDEKTKDPIHKATIFCSKDRFKEEIIKDGLTDSDGIYKMESIPSGAYYVIAEMEPSYESLTSRENIKGQIKKDFPLRKLHRYKLKGAEVVAVDAKTKTLIVEEIKGEKVKLATTPKTTFNVKEKFAFFKEPDLGWIAFEEPAFKDIKIGDKMSATYYGTTQQEGKVAHIFIERSSE